MSGGIGLVIHHNNVLRRIEQAAVDARYQIRGTDPAKVKDFVVVGIDGTTLEDLRNHGLQARFPFPRRYDARVIDQLRRAGAKVIALDLEITDRSTPTDDQALFGAIDRAHNVVMSTTWVGPHGTTPILGGAALLRQVGARPGEANLRPDSDGTIRSSPHSILGLRTFGVVMAERATGRPISASRFGEPNAKAPIDFAGPPGTVSSIPFSRVYYGRFPRSAVAGKVAIIGATHGALVQDVHETPMSSGTEMSGPELMANIAATALHGVPLRYPADWLTTLLILLLPFLVCLSGLRLGTLGVALVGIGAVAVWSAVAQIAFGSGTQLDYVDPAASLVIATVGTVLVGLREDGRERRRLREAFAANQRDIVEQVLQPAAGRPLEPTAVIAGYRIEAPIGKGGMGVVYRATQLALDRVVAIKLIATDRAQDPVFRERFKHESRLAASIEHVNVIPVYEAGEDDGLLFIAMRYVDGIDLASVLASEGALDPRRIALLMVQLAGALDAAHKRGLVHRDVKPANVLLTLDNPEHLYLTDFGIAKDIRVDDGMTREGELVGTLEYLAPEQIRGEPVGTSADVYALTGLLYHCLTGSVPFPRDNDVAKLWAHVNAPPPAPSRIRTDLPASADEVIARGMDKDPGRRFATASALVDAFVQALGLDIAVSAPRPAAARHEAHDVVTPTVLAPPS